MLLDAKPKEKLSIPVRGSLKGKRERIKPMTGAQPLRLKVRK
jgi:hypothetical protein